MNAFLEAYPNYKKLNHATLADFLEQVKKRQAERNRKSEQRKDNGEKQSSTSGDYQPVSADKWGLPDSNTGRAFAAVLEAIHQGDENYTRKFFKADVTEELTNAFPMSEHLKIFSQARESMDDFVVASAQKTGDHAGVVVIENKETGKCIKIDLEVEAKEPYRIVSMGVGPE